MRLLNESKRDDLLLPYVDIINQHCNANYSLGQVKKALLRRFQQFGGFSNLSLGSNYYLAGVARYYFNGDLTINKNLGVFDDTEDQWNREVCQRLNALILILRNVIVDSLGATFEQPEDFGDLPIKKLLRKYGAKIDAALGIVHKKNKEEKEEVDTLNRDPKVGNGDYTFDIMYSFEDCRKYNQYTTPGAWCITYGEQHYNYYVRSLNIHYVIFRQNGFENVPRKEERNMWKGNKPQDTYGNSLIALLQSNTNGEPVYITSRWNHGYETHVEADHAYTKEEFMKITGTSDADLQRIFEIWKKDFAKYKEKREMSDEQKQKRIEKLKVLRALKYDQMRINGGENPSEVFKDAHGDVLPSTLIVGNGKSSKSIFDVTVDVEGLRYHVLVDRGNIVFDSMVDDWDYYDNSYYRHTYQYSETFDDNGKRREDDVIANLFNNVIIVHLRQYCNMIYNVRTHQFVEIDGLKKFKYIENMPTYQDVSYKEAQYYEVKESANKIALVDAKTNVPLRLPNGEYWFERISGNDIPSYYGREIKPALRASNRIYIITYDSAMKKMFYFLPSEKRFLNIDPTEGNSDNEIYANNYKCGDWDSLNMSRKFSILSVNNNRQHLHYDKIYRGGQEVSINGMTKFKDCHMDCNRFIKFKPYDAEDNDLFECFDTETLGIFYLNGEPFKFGSMDRVGGRFRFKDQYKYLVFFFPSSPEDESKTRYWNMILRFHRALIYSMNDNGFLINPENNSTIFYVEQTWIYADNDEEKQAATIKVYDEFSNSNTIKTINLDDIKKEGGMIKAEVKADVKIEDEHNNSNNQEAQALSEAKFNENEIKNMVNEVIKRLLNKR